MALKKQYSKDKSVCKVTFTVPKEQATAAQTVYLVGDFNDWNTSINPLKRQKNGSLSATVSLKPNAEYQYRFLFDGVNWENDPQADRCVDNNYGSTNSVLEL